MTTAIENDVHGQDRLVLGMDVADKGGTIHRCRFVLFTSKEDQTAFLESSGIYPSTNTDNVAVWEKEGMVCTGHAARLLVNEEYFYVSANKLPGNRLLFALSISSAGMVEELRSRFGIKAAFDQAYYLMLGELCQFFYAGYMQQTTGSIHLIPTQSVKT
jgi:hypothetical protein